MRLQCGCFFFDMVCVMGVAQSECSKRTERSTREDETKTCLSCGMSVMDN